MKSRLVQGSNYTDVGMRGKVAALCAIFGYEIVGLIGEYTHNEQNQVNQCTRVDNLTFAVEVKGVIRTRRRGDAPF
jgi:hypothetical protein